METILLAESDPLEARTLSCLLCEEYRVLHCPELSRAPESARRSAPAAILLGFPPAYGPRDELIRQTAAQSGGAPLLVLAHESSPSDVVSCLRSGAFDFVAKPITPEKLRACLSAAIAPCKHGPSCSRHFLGTSAAIREVEKLVRLYADSTFPVLILGESGTGKEIAARALRDLGGKQGPFVARNCAAIPEEIAESELFGTERGAFTDAVSRPGAFELAAGGLLFLDEIGESGMAFQAKLLRVLETGEFWRLGARKSLAADFRFVSATSRDLPVAASEKRFRSDLLYRINTLVIKMPPLRDRKEDIAELAQHFALLASHGRASLDEDSIDKLMAYEWPGNVRELRNIVHRAIVLADHAEEIRAEHIVF
jgi:Response regulator containing CheY-like receiver, AAA-type ATPase, and DNA-binding domains